MKQQEIFKKKDLKSIESGALITANIAKDQNKKILSVPSDIYSITGEGTNQLILEGAEIYLNPRQLLVDECEGSFNKKLSKYEEKEKDKNTTYLEAHNKRNLNEIETKIVSCLKNDVKTIDEISYSILIFLFCF